MEFAEYILASEPINVFNLVAYTGQISRLNAKNVNVHVYFKDTANSKSNESTQKWLGAWDHSSKVIRRRMIFGCHAFAGL